MQNAMLEALGRAWMERADMTGSWMMAGARGLRCLLAWRAKREVESSESTYTTVASRIICPSCPSYRVVFHVVSIYSTESNLELNTIPSRTVYSWWQCPAPLHQLPISNKCKRCCQLHWLHWRSRISPDLIRFAHRYHSYMFLYEKLQVSFSWFTIRRSNYN